MVRVTAAGAEVLVATGAAVVAVGWVAGVVQALKSILLIMMRLTKIKPIRFISFPPT
jgi:hypothetical protein